MSRNRIIYQNEIIYVGPAFVSGETYSNPVTTNLDKIQSISYDFKYTRADISTLGKSSNSARPVASSPSANISMEYIITSFHNEYHLGMKVTQEGDTTINPVLAGIADETNRAGDKRNLYLSTMEDGTDAINGATGDIENVLSFQDCQLNSYSASFQVGALPSASVSLEGINANYYSSGSGLGIPVLNRRTATTSDTITVDLPTAANKADEIFLPGNINVYIYTKEGVALSESGFAPLTNGKVQDFSLDLNINRQSIDLIDHKIVYDKIPTFPSIGSATLSLIEHGTQSGSFNSLMGSDDEYKIVTKITNKLNQEKMSFIFNKVKFDSISYSNQIGSKKMTNLNFSFDADPSDSTKSPIFSGKYY